MARHRYHVHFREPQEPVRLIEADDIDLGETSGGTLYYNFLIGDDSVSYVPFSIVKYILPAEQEEGEPKAAVETTAPVEEPYVPAEKQEPDPQESVRKGRIASYFADIFT